MNLIMFSLFLAVTFCQASHNHPLHNSREDKATELLIETMSCKPQSYDRVKTALANGADPDAWNGHALHRAAKRGSPEMVALLLDKGAHPNLKRPYGKTCIHSLVEGYQQNDADEPSFPLVQTLEKIALFGKAGISLNTQDYCGETGLHCAYRSVLNTDPFAALISSGASLDKRNCHGKTVLDLVRSRPRCDVARRIYDDFQKAAPNGNSKVQGSRRAVLRAYLDGVRVAGHGGLSLSQENHDLVQKIQAVLR